jgi:hypothetical protein
MSLQERANFLQAPSTFSLCKTLILKNSKHKEDHPEDAFYPKNVILVTQFEEKYNSQRVVNFMKKW